MSISDLVGPEVSGSSPTGMKIPLALESDGTAGVGAGAATAETDTLPPVPSPIVSTVTGRASAWQPKAAADKRKRLL